MVIKLKPTYSFTVNNDNSVTISYKLTPGIKEHRDTICEIFGYPLGMTEEEFNRKVQIGIVEVK